VESGETLTSIAKKYHVTPMAVADANGLERNAAPEAGQKLIIPATQQQSETKRRLVSYRVRRGDTFLGIADRFSVSADDLRKWNRLGSNRVRRGMVLRIYTLAVLRKPRRRGRVQGPRRKLRRRWRPAPPAEQALQVTIKSLLINMLREKAGFGKFPVADYLSRCRL